MIRGYVRSIRSCVLPIVFVCAIVTIGPDAMIARNTGSIHRVRMLLIAVRRRRYRSILSTHKYPSLESFVPPPGDRWLSL